jgi:hypothetical protein
LAALERVASALFFTENRIECNAPTSTTGKQGQGWADVWRSALRAWKTDRSHIPMKGPGGPVDGSDRSSTLP